MLQLAGTVIAACWIVFVVVWFIAAWFAKRAVERSGRWFRWMWIALIVAILLAGTHGGWRSPTSARLWHTTSGLAIVAAVVTFAGLSIALWARATIGRNWSGAIVLKDQHELVDRGPYGHVRHPIYTGVLLMVLGAVLFWGAKAGVLLLGIVIVGLAVKARTEERLLMKHFPEAYPRYRARVRSWVIPFLL
ncbi:MAG TPA: isoprenylcysteine carboxylmethyltransferase family protein [Vicinamibacterales bacterium]|nr:isoprenylcysteine carboxylmethyltransferase family protein [Vicinamibacterales bacterium]